MAKIEIVQKYYFRKDDQIGSQGYDWIGKKWNNLYPVELNNKLGFADSETNIIIPIIYDRKIHPNDTVYFGNEKYLDLCKNNLHGLLTHDGREVIPFEWNCIELWNLSENLVPVSRNQHWGFINVTSGELQIPLEYDEVKPFKNGFASVRLGDSWGLINSMGVQIVEPKYLLDFYFDENFAIVYEGGYYKTQGNKTFVYDSNAKLLNMKGAEIVSGYSSIEKTGNNTFTFFKDSEKHIKQFIPNDSYIIIIEDGIYLEGYISPSELSSADVNSTFCPHAKYVGGGTWSVIDFSGKPINIPKSQLQKAKEDLLVQ